MRVLLTGATGILGAEVREQLAARGDAEVTCVARRAAAAPGTVAWDIAGEPPPAELRGPWDAIVNCAADTRWTMTVEEAARANVATVEALAELAAPGTAVVHISTAAAVGPRGGGADPGDPASFRNNYEWSKARADRVARELFGRLTIVRPPLIIGRRRDGRAARFAGMYVLLRGITSSSVPAVVAAEDGFFDVVPVDDVAAVVLAGVERPGAGEIHTVVCGPRAPRVGPTVELLCEALNEWRRERGVDPVAVPPIVSPDSWERFYLPFAREHLTRRQLAMLELLDNFRPYLELTEPFEPTHEVADVEPCIARSVRFWAERNPRLASLAPRPWTAAA